MGDREGDDPCTERTRFAGLQYPGKKRRTQREKFLSEMEWVVPWARLNAPIEPPCPRLGKVGRRPAGVARMLRMYLLQQWYFGMKAQIRALVEHPFHVVRNPFGYRTVSYRGSRKNGARLYAQLALALLVPAQRDLLDERVQGMAAS